MPVAIKAACDICGQIYKLSEDRLGKSTPCKVCGTKFVIEEYSPPAEQSEEDHDNPWPWIKGGFTVMLMLAILFALGRLPFIRPTTTVASDKPRNSIFPGSPPHAPLRIENRWNHVVVEDPDEMNDAGEETNFESFSQNRSTEMRNGEEQFGGFQPPNPDLEAFRNINEKRRQEAAERHRRIMEEQQRIFEESRQ